MCQRCGIFGLTLRKWHTTHSNLERPHAEMQDPGLKRLMLDSATIRTHQHTAEARRRRAWEVAACESLSAAGAD